jgi:hypothetical protein
MPFVIGLAIYLVPTIVADGFPEQQSGGIRQLF